MHLVNGVSTSAASTFIFATLHIALKDYDNQDGSKRRTENELLASRVSCRAAQDDTVRKTTFYLPINTDLL